MWRTHDSCVFKVGDYSGRKICAFDYDDTLCSLWTSNPLSNVVYTLHRLSDYYDILIFSNQKGVSLGKSTNLEVQRRFDEFCNKYNLSPTIIYSTKDDEYRKPMDGMVKIFNMNTIVEMLVEDKKILVSVIYTLQIIVISLLEHPKMYFRIK